MKKTVVVIAVLLIGAATASAQAPPKPFDIYLGGGLSTPMGDLSDGFKFGFHGTGAVSLKVQPMFDIVFGLTYHYFPFDDEEFVGDVDGGDASFILVGADAKYNFGIPQTGVHPHVLGGVGLAIVSRSDLTTGAGTTEFDSETKFYLEAGGGVDFKQVFVQAKVVFVPDGLGDESAYFLPLTVGVRF